MLFHYGDENKSLVQLTKRNLGWTIDLELNSRLPGGALRLFNEKPMLTYVSIGRYFYGIQKHDLTHGCFMIDINWILQNLRDSYKMNA